MNTSIASGGERTRLVHEAMPYRDDRSYLTGVLSFVHAALADDRPVLVELPERRLDLVRKALGADADRVEFGDMAYDGHNPAWIIPRVLGRFIDAHPGRHVAIVGEPIWPGRSTPAYAVGVQHEALINLAFADREAEILCPYDVAGLPEHALADAEQTHPLLRENGGQRPSPRYTDPRAVVASIAGRQPDPPPDAEVFEFSAVSQVREVAAQWASRAGLPPQRVTDLVIAISEVGGNSVAHAGNGGQLLQWHDNGWLVCEVRDSGHIADPLAGRLPPPDHHESGRGLLMVNYLCDLVQVCTDPSGTRIRLWMDLPPGWEAR